MYVRFWTIFILLWAMDAVASELAVPRAAPPVVPPNVLSSREQPVPRLDARQRLKDEVSMRQSGQSNGFGNELNGHVPSTSLRKESNYSPHSFYSPSEPGLLLPTSEPLSATEELIRKALVEPEKQVIISSGTVGKLVELRVPKTNRLTGEIIYGEDGEPVMIEIKAGQMLKEGQVIGKINDEAEVGRVNAAHAALEIAEVERTAKLLEVEFARATWSVAKLEVDKNTEMNKEIPGIVPHMSVVEAELKKIQAEKQWQKAKQDYEEVRLADVKAKVAELGIAESLLEQRKLYSPINGMVAEVWGAEGEMFREVKEILRIIRLDKLRIRGRVDGKRLTQQMVDNKQVTVTATGAKDRKETFHGKVVFASPEWESDQHFLIHVEVDNRMDKGYWLLNPGNYVELVIHLDKTAD